MFHRRAGVKRKMQVGGKSKTQVRPRAKYFICCGAGRIKPSPALGWESECDKGRLET